MGSPWGSRDFRLLVVGSSTSSVGNAITPVALAFAVIGLGGGASELGLVVAAFALTEVVTTLVGGVVGDRFARQLVMQGSAAASVVTQVVLATTLLLDVATIPLIAVLGAATGCLSSLSGPSSQAVTRLTVAPEQLGSAVALRSTVQNAAMILGFSLGGLLVGYAGPGWAIAVDAATYAVAAVCFGLLRVPSTRPAATDQPASMLADLGEGLREVLRHGWLVLLIAQALLYHLFYGGAQGVLGPLVVSERFSEAAWGWSLSALTFGFLAGSLVCLRWRPQRGLLVGTAMLSLTAAFPLAMALAHQLPVVLAGAFVHGFGLMVFSVNWDLSIQQNIAEDKLARVYAFDAVGSFVARPIGLAVTGPLAAAVGFDAWLLVIAAVIGGSSLLSLLSPDVRRLRRSSTLVDA